MFGTLIKRLYGHSAFNKLKIKDVLSKKLTNNQTVVEGWVHSVRKHKRAVFMDLNDGSTMKCLQVVVNPEMVKSGMSFGASISVEGDIVETKLHRDGIEMHCDQITLICPCNENYVFNKHANHDLPYLRGFPHMRMKETSMASVLRTRNAIEMEIHRYFQEKNFLHIHTPVLTSSDCEGAGETFSVTTDKHIGCILEGEEEDSADCELIADDDANTEAIDEADTDSDTDLHFFKKPVYLTVSSQLQLEACALGVGNVYTLNPAFRAEYNHSKKHLSEFRMLEVELMFTQSLNDIIDLMEDSIKSFLQVTREKCDLEQNHFFQFLPQNHKKAVETAAVKEYLRLSYSEALDILQRNSSRLKTYSPVWGDDFNPDHENCLLEHCDNVPLFIQDFPKESKPFYMFENEDEKTVSAVDLIFPFCGELCGGSVREHRLEVLASKLDKLGMRKAYNWYLELRKYGGAPHAGYGMGFDRLIRFVLGIQNIRDAVPFPRSARSCHL